MYKFMMITNYRYIENGKFGPYYYVNGLLYENIDNRVIGRQNYQMTVNDAHPLYNYVKKENIGKDVYLKFGPNGRVIQCEVK